ncbi:twin-arginine translocation signal domain-containing protein [Candidatus Aenigmatarchaeota archaeon]
MTTDRRRFLKRVTVGTAGIVAATHGLWIPEAYARTGSGKYDVSIAWGPDPETLNEYRDRIGYELGSGVRKRLRLVRGKSQFGLIYDKDGTKNEADDFAIHLRNLLIQENVIGSDDGDEFPIAITDVGYDTAWNVQYGVGPSEDGARSLYGKVYSLLGPNLGDDLVIEERSSGKYAVVYKRWGDEDSTKIVAGSHRRTLASHGIGATHVAEQGHDVIYTESTYLDETDEREVIARQREIKKKEPKREEIEDRERKRRAGTRQQRIEQEVNRVVGGYRRGGTLRDHNTERSGLFAKDMRTGERLMAFNADKPYQSASASKAFEALGLMHRAANERGFTYGSRSKKRVEAMLGRKGTGYGYNSSERWVMEQIGGPRALQSILKGEYGGIFVNTRIVEAVPVNGKAYRNKASARDYARFYEALMYGTIPECSNRETQIRFNKELRRVLTFGGGRIKGTRRRPGMRIYNKSGTTGYQISDAGAVVRSGVPYVIAEVLEDRVWMPWRKRQRTRNPVLKKTANVIHDEMERVHRL